MSNAHSQQVSPRARRLAERIHVLVAQLLDTRIKDPRLGFVTVTEVRMTGDLQHASIFYTEMEQPQAQTDTAAALQSATGLLRSEVGAALGLRLTPTLTFIPDVLPESVAQVDELLAVAKARDEAVRKASVGAQPAGDADPYRKPRVEAEAETETGAGTETMFESGSHTELDVPTSPTTAATSPADLQPEIGQPAADLKQSGKSSPELPNREGLDG